MDPDHDKVRDYLEKVAETPEHPESVQEKQESDSHSPTNPFDDQFDEFINGVDEGESMEMREGMKEMGLDKETIEKINEGKKNGMFVSAWQEDEEGIHEKDLDDPIERFLTAAEEGKIDEVKRMMEEDSTLIHQSDVDNYTALHRAAYNNHVNVVDYLLEMGANREARTTQGWTALHSACNWANFDVVGRLLSNGVEVNARSHGNLTPLHVALCSKEESESVFHTVRYLVQAPGIDFSAVSGAGDTPIELARRNNKECYELLKDKMERL